MVWIAALALSAAAYLLVMTVPMTRTGSRLPRILGLGVLLSTALVLLVAWAVSSGRLVSAAAPSLRFLTGLHSPGDVVPQCLTWGPGARWVLQIVVVILLLAAALVTLVPAVAGVVGVPLAVVACVVTGAVSAVRRDAEPVQFGLRLLSGALGCLVLAALVVRVLHAVYEAVLC